jgi:hypothetical protein
MAVLFVYEAKGDPAELLKRYHQAGSTGFKNAKHEAGSIAQICVETPDGIQVLNLMESADHMNKLLNDPELGNIVEKCGLSSVHVSHTHHNYKVHDYHVKG